MKTKNKETKNTEIVVYHNSILSLIISGILIAILCDICGCSWSHGFCEKIRDSFIQAEKEIQHSK